MKTIDGKPLFGRFLVVGFPDGTRWAIPELTIAESRAAHYADDEERSLNEDTLPFFRKSPGEMSEWAANNMDWEDVESDAIQLESEKPQCDRDDEWPSCSKSFREFKGETK
jgi:hypothetical protein